MTVGTEACGPTLLSWTGAETSFAAGFVAYDASHVIVGYRDGASGALSTLTAGLHYAVVLTGGPPGAVSVTPLAMPPAPGTVILLRQTPAVQGVDFNDLASYSADVHEKIGDLGAMRDAEERSRTLRLLLDGTYDAGGHRIKNVGDAAANGDAVNLGFMNNAAASLLAQINTAVAHVDAVATALDAALLAVNVAKLIDFEGVIGQSNGVGSAYLIESPVGSGIFVYTTTNPIPGTVFKYRSGAVAHGNDPHGGTSTNNQSVWPSYGAAKNSMTGVPLIFANAAVGSTNIAQVVDGLGGLGNWRVGGTLLTDAFAMFDAALAAIAAAPFGYTVRRKTINIFQGEFEASVYAGLSSGDKASAFGQYKTNWDAVCTAIWAKYGTDTRIQFWQIGTSNLGDDEGWVAIRQAIDDLVSVKNHALVRVVSEEAKAAYSLGLMQAGELHFNAEMAEIMGPLAAFTSVTGVRLPVFQRRGIYPAATQDALALDPVTLYGFGIAGGNAFGSATLNLKAVQGHGYSLRAIAETDAEQRKLAVYDEGGTLLWTWAQDASVEPRGLVKFAASTTARASLNIAAGTAPTVPQPGDFWTITTDLKGQFSGTTYTFTKT